MREWGITHNTISPHNSKANGKVESAVKTAKKLLKRCGSTGESRNLALLNIRNTPTQGVDSSPAQRFLGRRTRTIIPTVRPLLQPRGSNQTDMRQLRHNQQTQAKYYDRKTKILPALHEGDVVRMKPFQPLDDKWRKARVQRRLDERSYEVCSGGHTYRRNREHLRAAKSARIPDSDVYIPDIHGSMDGSNNTAHSLPTAQATQPDADDQKDVSTSATTTQTSRPPADPDINKLRRSSRRRHPPQLMKDFVTY
ncbi:uncharacterized protein [Diadema setosum]|uniref:uncharacterized protein n=1 Tax=Diadema setosum TaxID=31175 RepID=UPI003B3B58C5